MRDPFKIDSPTCISFSGGRTSAYMLWRVLQSHGGQLPKEALVCFANTGKEEEATLRFVRDCGEHWGVPITWLEYQREEPGYKVVAFDTASRNGEPFEALLAKKQYLPSPVMRFCTVELKIRPMAKYQFDIGITDSKSEGETTAMVGIRADEQRRAAKIPDKGRLPLVTAGVTKHDVSAFWRAQPFDLELPNNNGVTMHGNCDLCYLKPTHQVVSLIAEKPERAIWWARMESTHINKAINDSGRFRKDRPSYAKMAKYAADQLDMFDQSEEGIACFCGD
jgi:3'-phosphoadenosine 5'-phosphosulfate sulfotransferase (PAPS reductase)/FAD synthetase